MVWHCLLASEDWRDNTMWQDGAVTMFCLFQELVKRIDTLGHVILPKWQILPAYPRLLKAFVLHSTYAKAISTDLLTCEISKWAR